jgi:hypothetical protein
VEPSPGHPSGHPSGAQDGLLVIRALAQPDDGAGRHLFRLSSGTTPDTVERVFVEPDEVLTYVADWIHSLLKDDTGS